MVAMKINHDATTRQALFGGATALATAGLLGAAAPIGEKPALRIQRLACAARCS